MTVESARVAVEISVCLVQGVKAEQQASLARSLQARLKTSEDNAELLKSFSSPQVSTCTCTLARQASNY